MPEQIKLDLFKPQQPRIPGVVHAVLTPTSIPEESVGPRFARQALERVRLLIPLLWVPLTIAVILATGAGLLLWGGKNSHKLGSASQPIGATLLPPVATAPKNPGGLPVAPGVVATTEELEKPWSSKQFLFRNPVTNVPFRAIVVRLPGGALWGLSLHQPFGDCELEYQTSAQKLQTDFRVHSTHPMVVDPCSGAVFDLSQYSNGPNGLVRGEIVAGSAVRPPLAIEIQTRGKQVFAVRAE
jgi:hypothetical protein